MRVSADYRAIARESLQGKWLSAAVVYFVATFLGASIALEGSRSLNIEIPSTLKENAEVLPLLYAVIATLVVLALVKFVIGGAVTLGYARYNLSLVDGREAGMKTIFTCFDRLWSGFCLQLLRRVFIALWSLLFVIPGIVKTYAYAMAPYILLEHPELTDSDAISLSQEIMEGNKSRLFWLNLSFIGWELLVSLPSIILSFALIGAHATADLWLMGMLVLCMIPASIGGCFVEAYREAAFAAFYRDVSSTRFSVPSAVKK